jgi:hypothetical protein
MTQHLEKRAAYAKTAGLPRRFGVGLAAVLALTLLSTTAWARGGGEGGGGHFGGGSGGGGRSFTNESRGEARGGFDGRPFAYRSRDRDGHLYMNPHDGGRGYFGPSCGYGGYCDSCSSAYNFALCNY